MADVARKSRRVVFGCISEELRRGEDGRECYCGSEGTRCHVESDSESVMDRNFLPLAHRLLESRNSRCWADCESFVPNSSSSAATLAGRAHVFDR